MKTEKTVTNHSDAYIYATVIESIRHDDTLDKMMMRDALRRLIADFDKAVIADMEKQLPRRCAAVAEHKNCCVNCGIRSVPLYLGLDGRLHCADHIGLLVQDTDKTHDKPEQPAEEEQHG